MIRKLLRFVLVFIAFLAGITFLYLATEYILSRKTVLPKETDKPTKLIFIRSNKVHTDLVLPVETSQINWAKLFPYTDTKGKDTHFEYVGIGWGDKGFYLDTPEWKDLKPSTAFVAATGLGEAALHVTYYKDMKEDELTRAIWVSDAQYQSIINSIKETIIWQNNHPIYIETNAQYGEDDAFYEANGKYSIFYTCNTWTNNVLKKAGLKASFWAAFDDGLMSQYP
ncbi:TIGR02117 family protein [Weeksella virosa]|uniref:Urease-associated protein n=1 Tax=Weeksella virosa (strain ATCC 43766 / DSM 16922 / JCM 21250 / CCUG 30538 / CDC 9751 / IAM 14551 / NBRC 16016 / NCTC 11634 / CL345/78) TaxID=865938 RepID=F0P105_WEEVC|nr:TIGR02117 family protein [Weeksella virosa]ADX68589.1 Conserved hypothetical protein CHP02117 [Weeksella virosa DSM 16922]MDK7675236.1 TIGR02117 family protein [Weeksella virosa]SUP54929.1 Protein of uncharacterised function (DUF2459) [Weeksella virosa]VEH63748.1 Protein of uncharacterised function (DUF2459) [Weeksella virosa]